LVVSTLVHIVSWHIAADRKLDCVKNSMADNLGRITGFRLVVLFSRPLAKVSR